MPASPRAWRRRASRSRPRGCSPGRAAFFVGRYPLRTDMYQALGPNDLANSQLSPHDVTVPKLLKRALEYLQKSLRVIIDFVNSPTDLPDAVVETMATLPEAVARLEARLSGEAMR